MFLARWRPHVYIRLDAPSCQVHAKTPLFPCEDKLGPCKVKREWNLLCTLTAHTLTIHLGQISCKPSHVNYTKKETKGNQNGAYGISPSKTPPIIQKQPYANYATLPCKLSSNQRLSPNKPMQTQGGTILKSAHHAKLSLCQSKARAEPC